MNNETEKELSVLVQYKIKMLKWGIATGVLLVALLIIFFKGYSNGTKKW